MATIIHKTINGHGPYAYKVTYSGGKHHWTYLGRAGAVDTSPGPVTNDGDEPGTNTNTAVNTDAINDSGISAAANELDETEVEDVIDTMLFDPDTGHENYHNILTAVKNATSDEELRSNIETLQQFETTRPSLVEAAGERVEEELGIELDVQITDPDSEYQNPMVQTDVVEDNARLTNNPDVNAELLEHATTDIGGEYTAEQSAAFDKWKHAIGDERTVEIKRSLDDPDALGFAIPGDVPATGDRNDRTPVTEIPYIGDSTAEDMHPSGDIMSVEDLENLTDKQASWVEFPINNRDYDNQRTRGVVRGIAEHTDENTADILGTTLGMMDQRDRDRGMRWRDSKNVLGITDGSADGFRERAGGVSPVTAVEKAGDGVVVETEAGYETKFSKEHWGVIESVVEGTGDGVSSIEVGEDAPAIVELPDGNEVIASPKIGDED